MADGDCVSPDIAFGPYLAEYTWDAVDTAYKPDNVQTGWQYIGLIEGAARLNQQHAGEDVTANQFGESVIDTVFTGGNVFYTLIAKEWTLRNRQIMWPWGTGQGNVGPIGASMCDSAGALRLTPQPGSRAADSQGGASTAVQGGAYLFRRAILSAEMNQELLFGNTPRDITMTFRCFPYQLGEAPDLTHNWWEYFDDTANLPNWP
jgi:hypothetical protein